MRGSYVLPAILGAICILVTACSPGLGLAGETANPEDSAETLPTSVAVSQVTVGDISAVYTYAGDLQAVDSINLVPMVNGRVQEIPVVVGDRLQTGDPIAVIDSENYEAQLKQAQAALKLAKANLAKMEDGTRQETLAAARSAVQYSREALDDVETVSDDERTTAAAALAQAEAQLKLAQSEYDKIAWAGQAAMMPQALQLEQATIAYDAASSAYELQTNPTEGQLAPLKAQLAQAEASLALAEDPFTDNDFELVYAQIEQAEASVALAQKQVNETVIRAPFDGTLAELYISEGSMVGTGSPVALFVSDKLEAVVGIEENRISQVYLGQDAALQVSAFPGQNFPGVVSSVAPVADQSSHTFTVKVTPIDDDHLLRSGMYANVSLLVEERNNVILVPSTAVLEMNGQPVLFVVNHDGLAELREVTVGLEDGNQMEIRSGLIGDEQVIVKGYENLQDGMKVNVAQNVSQVKGE